MPGLCALPVVAHEKGVSVVSDSTLAPLPIWKLVLPFPPSILRPNDRSHWAKKNPHKNAFKLACHQIATAQPVNFSAGRIALHVTFYPPNNRWDFDAQVSACKALFDGIADAWGVNDRRFRPVMVFEDADKNNPRVEIKMAGHEPGQPVAGT